MKKLNRSGFGLIEVLLAIVLLTGLGGAGYLVWRRSQNSSPSVTSIENVGPKETADKLMNSLASKDSTTFYAITAGEIHELSQAKFTALSDYYSSTVLGSKSDSLLDEGVVGEKDVAVVANTYPQSQINKYLIIFLSKTNEGWKVVNIMDSGDMPKAKVGDYSASDFSTSEATDEDTCNDTDSKITGDLCKGTNL